MIFILPKRHRTIVLTSNYLEQIRKKNNVRQNLIELKQLIRDDNQKKALAYEIAGDFSDFTVLLKDEDPKVRKNAVLILGEMECDDLADLIWDAYEAEQTMFVKADYIKSLSKCECRQLLPKLKIRLQELSEKKVTVEEEKHVRAEIFALQALVLKYNRPKHHKFTGFDNELEVILMTNRNHREVTVAQLPAETEVKMLSGGIRFQTTHLEEVLKIRTYTEMLFPIPGLRLLEGSPDHMAKQLVHGGMLRFLNENHAGNPPFYFRLEIKSGMAADRRIDLVKKMSLAIERESDREMVNTTSGYELEIRLVANKEGRFIPLLKLSTIPDWKFSYRKEVLPTSVTPANAALFMALAGSLLKKDARVLDPFCGTGTMLIERARFLPCNTLYGIDILEEAIQKAKVNTELANIPIHYINRNYFDFKHEYHFDEIVTNLPGVGRNKDAESLQILYDRFLQKSQKMLENNGIVVAYTTAPEILKKQFHNYPAYILEKEAVINERENSRLLVLRYHIEY